MNAHEQLVDRVAEAIHKGRNGKGCTPWSRTVAQYKDAYRADAKAAIATVYAALQEPSDEMIDASLRHYGTDRNNEYAVGNIENDWEIVWAASPLNGE